MGLSRLWAHDGRLDAARSVLASAYLGAVSYAGLAAAGRVIELRPGALAQADALFAVTRQPFCATDF